MNFSANKKKVDTFQGKDPIWTLDVLGIMQCIPNRYPFLLIDRVYGYEGAAGIGIKNVTCNEPFFVGHFPSHPVMPGVLILEAMVQTACVVVCRSESIDARNSKAYFTGADEAKFRKPVVPGDVLQFYTTRKAQVRNVWKYETVALVGDVVVAEAKHSVALIDEKVPPIPTHSFPHTGTVHTA